MTQGLKQIKQIKIKEITGKVTKLLAVILLVLIFGFSHILPLLFLKVGLPEVAEKLETKEALAAAQGDGIIVYGKSATAAPQYRLYDSATNTWGTETPVGGATFTGVPRFIVVKTSATRDEAIVGALNDTGTLFIVRWNGTSWSQLGSNITATIADAKAFDIIYENTSGDTLVMVGGAVDPSYYVWNGSVWSGPTTITQATKTTGTIRWVELTSRKTSGSDELALAYADASGDLNALIWSGSAWTEQTAAAGALDTALENNQAATTMRAFDIEYESISGDLLITWGTNNSVDPRYVTRTAAGTWSGVLAASTFVEIPSIMNVAAEPWGDRVAVGLQNDTTGNSNDGDCGIWNGTGWVNTVNCDIARDSQEAGDMVLGSGWVKSGTDTRAINFYSDIADLTLDYNYWVPDTGWTTTQAFTPSPNCISANSDDNSFVVDHNPFNNAEIMIVRQAGSAICTQKTNYAGANTFNFGNAGAGSSLATPSVSQYQPVGFAYFKYVPNTLVVDATGTQAVNLNSGDTNQHIGGASTNAFTLRMSNTTTTVTNVKITETGTVSLANLTSPRLYYKNGSTCTYDGTESNVTATPVGETITFSLGGASVPISPNYLCLYFVFNVDGSATGTKGGQTIDVEITNPSTDITIASGQNTDTALKALSGTTTIKPNAISTTYGSGLSDGGRSGESITISGYGFGAALVGSRDNCAGGVDTGCVRFTVGGNATVATGDVSAWSNTSITYTINSSLASYGGVSAVELVASSQADATKIDFYIYPNITGMATCASGGDRDSACGTNAAQEYNAADTFGLIMLNGDHFNTAAGTVQFTGAFGSIAGTVHATAEGPCTTGGWGSTGAGLSVCVEVNSTISNTIYDGTVTLTRASDSKTDTIDLHILPRIALNTPTADIVGNIIQIDGDHFCQTGVCPPIPPTADSIAYFGSTQAIASDFVTTPNCTGASKWSDTQVCVKVLAGTSTGVQKTKIQGKLSPLYESQRKDFTVQSTQPNVPTISEPPSRQYKSNDTTVIAVGGTTNESSVYLKADMSASLAINMLLQIEVQPVGAAFTCTGTNAIGTGGCAAYASGAGALEGTVVGGGGCNNCTSLSQAKINFTGLTDGTKHWQVRARNTSTNEYSAWVAFGANLETEIDFKVDTTAPTITFTPTDTCAGGQSNLGTNGVTISWSINESADGQVEYSVNSDLTSSTSYPVTPEVAAMSHAIALSNLNSGTVYYYRVKSRDSASNLGTKPSISPFCSFTTGTISQPAKTTSFYITGKTGIIAATVIDSTNFSVLAPETSPIVKSAFVEVTGITNNSGTNNVQIQVNSQTVKTYAIDAASKSYFKIIYEITSGNLNLNDIPLTNTLAITPSLDTYIASAKVVVSYAYTP